MRDRFECKARNSRKAKRYALQYPWNRRLIGVGVITLSGEVNIVNRSAESSPELSGGTAEGDPSAAACRFDLAEPFTTQPVRNRFHVVLTQTETFRVFLRLQPLSIKR